MQPCWTREEPHPHTAPTLLLQVVPLMKPMHRKLSVSSSPNCATIFRQWAKRPRKEKSQWQVCAMMLFCAGHKYKRKQPGDDTTPPLVSPRNKFAEQGKEAGFICAPL